MARSETGGRPARLVLTPFAWGVVSSVALALSWAVVLGVRRWQWWRQAYERDVAYYSANGFDASSLSPTPDLGVWLSSVLAESAIVLVVAVVAAALVDTARPLVALSALTAFTVAPAFVGTTAVLGPLGAGTTGLSPGWPWTDTALALLVMAVPAAVTLLLQHHRVTAPTAHAPPWPGQRVTWDTSSVSVVVALATGISLAVRLSPDVGEVLVTGSTVFLADAVAILAVVTATTLLVATARRPLASTALLAIAGVVVSTAHSWYEVRVDTVTVGGLVVTGPAILLLAPYAGRAWRGAFRRGPVLSLRRVDDRAGALPL